KIRARDLARQLGYDLGQSAPALGRGLNVSVEVGPHFIALHQLQRNGVEVFPATASFLEPHRISLAYPDRERPQEVTADHVVIAVGTRVVRDAMYPFDGRFVVTSDEILDLPELPRTLTVVGAGVIGTEYASIFAALGVRVNLVDKRSDVLDFIDGEIRDDFLHHLRQNGVTQRFGESVQGVSVGPDGVCVALESGKRLHSDVLLYAGYRAGAVDRLNLEGTAVQVDSRGRIQVDENYRTDEPSVFAVGDVIGFPSLASTSMEQGRVAACNAFDVPVDSFARLFPYGIYTIPEMSVVGRNEAELTRDGVCFEVGRARYREIARGQILGDTSGLLKLLFEVDTRQLLGVAIMGTGASELIHIGQAVLANHGTLDYFINTVFNYPTLAECYKTAAFDGINRLPKVRPAVHSVAKDESEEAA
ncbi:MAG: Si-specific NAD(P)(+) transhydrogenase, partial [Myxococcota bacterium]